MNTAQLGPVHIHCTPGTVDRESNIIAAQVVIAGIMQISWKVSVWDGGEPRRHGGFAL